MQKEPLVSIIVPVYRVEKYIRACVDSILKQTYRNLDIILVDDGSPDNCGTICDEYAKSDCRIRVIHQENSGLSAARNAGLDAAKGEYIAFVDSDDWIREKTIERAMDAYKKDGVDLVIFNIEPVYEVDYVGDRRMESPVIDEILTPKQLANKLHMSTAWNYCVACNKLYKRNIFDNLRFPIGYIHEDEAIFHRVIAQCQRIETISEKMYMYRQVNGSIMSSGFSVKRTDMLTAMADRLHFARKYKWQEYEKKLAIFYEEKFWEWYHRFADNSEYEIYVKRMEKSLRFALPSILNNSCVLVSHKIYLSLLAIHPRLYKMVKRMIDTIKRRKVRRSHYE